MSFILRCTLRCVQVSSSGSSSFILVSFPSASNMDNLNKHFTSGNSAVNEAEQHFKYRARKWLFDPLSPLGKSCKHHFVSVFIWKFRRFKILSSLFSTADKVTYLPCDAILNVSNLCMAPSFNNRHIFWRLWRGVQRLTYSVWRIAITLTVVLGQLAQRRATGWGGDGVP